MSLCPYPATITITPRAPPEWMVNLLELLIETLLGTNSSEHISALNMEAFFDIFIADYSFTSTSIVDIGAIRVNEGEVRLFF